MRLFAGRRFAATRAALAAAALLCLLALAPSARAGGCDTTKTVKKAGGGNYLKIQDAVYSATRTAVNNNWCINIDSATYSEQVTVSSIVFTYSTNTFTIQTDPAVSTAARITPPALSTAAFWIANSSINIYGIDIVSTNTIPYGVLASSAYVQISSVDVSTSGFFGIYTAGMRVSSASVISYSSVTVYNAHGIWLAGSSGTVVSYSTMVTQNAGFNALYLFGADNNTVANSYARNLSGNGILLDAGSDKNTVVRSTAISVSTGAGFYALYVNNSSTNTVLDSYIQGSTAAFISGSTGTMIGGSTFIANVSGGSALALAGGSVNLSLTTSTVKGGATGAGIYMSVGNSGAIALTSNTVTGGRWGALISAMNCAGTCNGNLSISSMIFSGSLASGATAIHFTGGTFVSTFAYVSFNDFNIGANVNAVSLLGGSRITMSLASGIRAGPAFEDDPAGFVDWGNVVSFPGCALTRTVCASSCDATSIQGGVNSLPNPLTGYTCLIITDNRTYSEQVTVRNFIMNGSSLSILGASGQMPAVTPPRSSTAAFLVANSSVNIFALNVVSTNSVPYGIWASSSYVQISSVGVSTSVFPGIYTAGIRISSWSAISYSSVTLWNAHGLWLDGSTMTAISYSTVQTGSPAYYALYVDRASSNTFTSVLASNAAGMGAVFASSSNFNAISRSTITSGAGSAYALSLLGASSNNTITQSRISNSLGDAVNIAAASDFNTISQSTITSSSAGGLALYLNASFNRIQQSYAGNSAGMAVFLDASARFNLFLQSVVASASGADAAFHMFGASSNTITQSSIGNPAGPGAILDSNCDYNTINQSTISSNSGVDAGLSFIGPARYNVITQSYISNLSGDGAALSFESDYNTISLSTMTGGATGPLYAALRLDGAVSNTITQCFMNNTAGHGAYLEAGASSNTIIRSTMTSSAVAADQYGLFVSGASSNTILDSYVQGSTAAYISGSTGTVIGGTVFVATGSAGTALALGDGSVNLTLTTSTFQGGLTGAAIITAPNNSGLLSVTSSTLSGGRIGIVVAKMSCGGAGGACDANLSISNLIIAGPMTAGATAVYFTGGLYVSTLSYVNFNAGNIAVNVNGLPLNVASRVTLRSDSGLRTGSLYENDPNNLVYWASEMPGCVVTKNVGAGENFASISGALANLKANNNPLPGPACVVIRDGATYNEQVTVQNFSNNGSTITIMADPDSGAVPQVSPNGGMTAGFVIANASVNVRGIVVWPSAAVSYGVWASSAYVQLTSVTVTGVSISNAGVRISSWSAVSYSSVTVSGAYGIWLDGSVNTVLNACTVSNTAGSLSALYFDAADSNTVTGSSFGNSNGDGVSLESDSDFNTISLSTMTSGFSGANALVLFDASSNTITQSYVGNPVGRAASLNFNSNFNTISLSTIISNAAAFAALELQDADANVVSGSYIRGLAGVGASISANSDFNVISLSTISSAAQFGLSITGSSMTTVYASYVQGSTAAYIFNSSGTRVDESALIATAGSGDGLYFSGNLGAGMSATVVSSLLGGGPLGRAACFEGFNAGRVMFATNTIRSGARYGIFLANMPGASVWIGSNTVQPSISNSRDTYGVYMENLPWGATIQNNSVYYRTPGSAAGFSTYAVYLKSSGGLYVNGNRIGNPGMLTAGSFYAFFLNNAPNSSLLFNDVFSSGTTINNHYIVDATNSSGGLTLKNNIFFSSAVASTYFMVAVDGSSQSGISSDYNDYISANTLALQWGGTNKNLVSWQTTAPFMDVNTISRDPLWTDTAAGGEDFHPMSRAANGRYNPLSGSFDSQDPVTSPTIDVADPIESFVGEPANNGSRANQGSYGTTAEASKTPRRFRVLIQ